MFATKTLGIEASLIQTPFLVAVRVNTGGLGKNIGADDRRIGSHPLTREIFYHLTEVVYLRFIECDFHSELVAQRNCNRCQRDISSALAQAIYGGVNGCHTRFHSCHRVGRSESIVIMGVKIECQARVTVTHIADAVENLFWAQHAECVWQHHVGDFHRIKGFDHLINIVTTVAIPIRPVF